MVRVRVQVMIVGLCLGLLAASNAHGFFPLGGFDEFNRLTYVKWSMPSMNDANNDGDISGPNEGIEIMFEGGPFGWTDDEIKIIKGAFGVWQAAGSRETGAFKLGRWLCHPFAALRAGSERSEGSG